jgi:hypothetical protein
VNYIGYMKVAHPLLLLALVTTGFAAEDIRSKVLEGQPQVELDRTIDPDKSIFGFALGTTEDAFVEKCGNPVGYLRLKGDKSVILYGNSMAFLFEDKKLTSVFLGDDIVNYPISNDLQFVDLLDDKGWKLSNGIKNKMDLVAVRKILGDKLIAEDSKSLYNHYYLTEKSRVTLSFSRSGIDTENDESAYSLLRVRIEPKKDEEN